MENDNQVYSLKSGADGSEGHVLGRKTGKARRTRVLLTPPFKAAEKKKGFLSGTRRQLAMGKGRALCAGV